MTKEYYFMPCYVHKNPAPIIFPHELMIWYPWPDRCGENWSIVHKKMVVLGYECLSRGNNLNHLLPALFTGNVEFQDDFAYVNLHDLDGKWIEIEKSKLVRLTLQEAHKSLRNPEFLKEKYMKPLQDFELKQSRTVDIQTGLFEKDKSLS